MSTAKRIVVGGLLVVAAVLGTQAESRGQFGRGQVRPETRGVIKAVDTNAGTITIAGPESREAAATEKTYTLGKNVEIALSDGSASRAVFTEGKLSDLAPGATVSLTLAEDQTVESIAAEGPFVRGLLKRVDAAAKKLTVINQAQPRATREAAAEEESSYYVSPQAEVAIDDGRGRRFSIKEGKLEDLAAGSLVNLRLSPDQKEVQSILAEGPNVTGTIKSLDAGKKTITLQGAVRGGEGSEDRNLTLADDAVVLVDDGKGRRLSVKPAKLADIPAGAMAMAKLSADQQTITMIRAEGPSVPGIIKSVNGDQIVIATAGRGRGEPADEKTLAVAADARIVIDGNVKALGDLKVGENGQFAMLRLSLDQKTVQAIQTVPGR